MEEYDLYLTAITLFFSTRNTHEGAVKIPPQGLWFLIICGALSGHSLSIPDLQFMAFLAFSGAIYFTLLLLFF